MNLLERSLEIALKSHTGQTDRAGKPYILHPLRLMAKMDTDEEKAVALLHDVIEDSSCTAEALLDQEIPDQVVTAILHLTKQEHESYKQFIDRCLKNELATKVKVADIEDNLNLLRLHTLNDDELIRIAKYHKAWKRLRNTGKLATKNL